MPQNTAEHLKSRFIDWLLKENLGFSLFNKSIGVEVLFSQNRRKADLVIIGKELHAFEIKGDRDNLSKLKYQIADYKKTFDRVSIVTSAHHLTNIKRFLSQSVGIILADDNDFKVLRRAKLRRKLSKQSLLMFLPKAEVASLLQLSRLDNYSTDQVRLIGQRKLSLNKIRRASVDFLRERYEKLFTLFMKDKGNITHIDDLLTLTGRVRNLSS